MLPGNENRITAALFGSQKAGNQEKVSCFFVPVFVKCCYENTKRFSGELCHIFLPVRSDNDGKNIPAKLAEAPPSPSRVSAEASTAESVTFLEQDSTTVPNFANRSICPAGILLGLPPQARLLRLAPLEKSTHERRFTAMKKYNTPHRRRVIKTRLTEEEYAEFSERVTLCKMSQSEYIRQALIKSSIRPVITVSPVNDELLSAVGKLTAEYGKIGGNLNQIARCLNEYGAPYNALSQEVRAAITELAALKFEVLQKVGEAVGNIQTYQL